MATNFNNPAVPNLPLGPDTYGRNFIDQYSNVLRLYFNQLRNAFDQLDTAVNTLEDASGTSLLPFGAFYDTTTQSVISTTTAYVVNLSNIDGHYNTSLVSGTQMKVATAGYYNLQFSVQLSNIDNAPQDIDIWVRKNGVDIPYSNSRFGLGARKNPADPYHTVGTVNIFPQMAVNDYLELVWSSTSTNAKIQAYSAGASPTRPAIASVIATLSFVSTTPP